MPPYWFGVSENAFLKSGGWYEGPKWSQLSWEAEKTIENEFWLKNLQKCDVIGPKIDQKVL